MSTEATLQEKANGFIQAALKPQRNTPFVSTPADFGSSFEEVEFSTSDGVNLKAWFVRSGTNKVIVQAHFVTANRSGLKAESGPSSELSKTAQAFVDAGYSVLMFDARNHGQSDVGPVPYAIGTTQDSPDYVAAVDFVHALPGYQEASVGVVGMCFGASALPGAFAISDNLQTRSCVKAITIIQPGTWGQLMRKGMGDELIDEVNRQLAEHGCDSLDKDSMPNAKSINVPTMLMHNKNDPLGDREYTQAYFDALPVEKELHWIDGPADRAYAYRHITEHPEAFVAWFERWCS